MRILGLDITSAPRRAKPITMAVAELTPPQLVIRQVLPLPTFDAFEQALDQPGPWVAALDMPFGQSRALVSALGLPPSWSDYVPALHQRYPTRQAWADALTRLRAVRPPGSKEFPRRVDPLAGSSAASKCFHPPVAKMFYEGAWRLWLYRERLSTLPCLSNPAATRVVVEAYPKLVAARLLTLSGKGPRTPYKSDSQDDPARRAARALLVATLQQPDALLPYGLHRVTLGFDPALLTGPSAADELDAVLCAVQAAWSHLQRDGAPHPYGLDWSRPDEGWIADPHVRSAICSGP